MLDRYDDIVFDIKIVNFIGRFSQKCVKRLLASSVRLPAWKNSVPNSRIFIKFDI